MSAQNEILALPEDLSRKLADEHGARLVLICDSGGKITPYRVEGMSDVPDDDVKLGDVDLCDLHVYYGSSQSESAAQSGCIYCVVIGGSRVCFRFPC
jgi:hypothetical protein